MLCNRVGLLARSRRHRFLHAVAFGFLPYAALTACAVLRVKAPGVKTRQSGLVINNAKGSHPMRLSQPSILLAASLILFSVTQAAAAGQLCKPVLSLRDVRTSEPREMQRTWTGVLVADASQCSTKSGPFDMLFTRLKEVAPDLQFTERFTWVSGQSELLLDVWWDEWVEDYRILSIAPCPCRD
jgi:hypothetical protein